ncbi:hypothetical protein OJO94_02690 [Campylobacter lari]|uniref:hypothetical protein n=1 Tax=Campylobacter lari TaxID=201 RepID=UPI001811E340|nr:hypothetical protein [Campylobacter lari]EAJ0341128.1 hypothetical protein [Campylobacter lari]EIV6476413.1 hypothetical protein [Campylobacter lari]MCW0184000.1 hypothetical protein [Campylobacter lari]
MILEQFIDENERCNKILVCENKVKLTLGCNGREFYKILIDTKDTSKLKNEITRCDYVIATTNLKDIIIYVELKGGDLQKAFDQISNTHNFLNEEFSKRYIAIAYTGTPKASSILQRNTILFKKRSFQRPFTSTKALTLKYDSETQEISK